VRLEQSAEGLEPLFESVKEIPSSKSITKKQYLETCRKFDCLTIFDDDPIGVIFFDDNKVAHIAILPEYRGKCWKEIFQAMDYGKKKYGSFYGAAYEQDKQQQVFIKMLGFKEIGRDQGLIVYGRE